MAITRVGVGAQADSAVAGAVVPGAYPAAYAAVADDVAVLIVVGKPTAGTASVPAVPAGYTQQATINRAGQPLRIVVYTRVLQVGDPAPSVTVPAVDAWSTLMTVQLAVYNGVDPTTPLDVAAVTASAAAATTWSAPAITSASANCMILSMVGTTDDNALGLLLGSENGFTPAMSGASYDTTTGTDAAVGLADKIQAAAGLVTMCTWEETVVGTDPWVGVTLALRELVAGGSIQPPRTMHQHRTRRAA